MTGTQPTSLHLDNPATPEMELELVRLLSERAQGRPLQYMLGEWEFYGLPFEVGPGVLIPRQDTETLVDVALDILRDSGKNSPEVLDLCSGSGCVAIAIKHHFPGAKVTALEASDKALPFLEKNIALNGVDVACVNSDLREYRHPFPVDVIVSNPPYIPRGDLPGLQTEVAHEPIVALDGGDDGLDFFRAISRRYRNQLAPGGILLMEIGIGQQESAAEILASFGFVGISGHKDLNGIVRVIQAQVEEQKK